MRIPLFADRQLTPTPDVQRDHQDAHVVDREYHCRDGIDITLKNGRIIPFVVTVYLNLKFACTKIKNIKNTNFRDM
jgi:hypothetical protein